jgi:hypothetical protein
MLVGPAWAYQVANVKFKWEKALWLPRPADTRTRLSHLPHLRGVLTGTILTHARPLAIVQAARYVPNCYK